MPEPLRPPSVQAVLRRVSHCFPAEAIATDQLRVTNRRNTVDEHKRRPCLLDQHLSKPLRDLKSGVGFGKSGERFTGEGKLARRVGAELDKDHALGGEYRLRSPRQILLQRLRR